MSVSLHVSERNQWLVLSLSGRVDAFSDKRLAANLRAAGRPSAGVVLDLSRCEFLSLYFQKSLLAWKKELVQTGGDLMLLSPAESIRRQLDIFMGRELRIYDSWDTLEIESFYKQSRSAAPASL
jgi:anti-anti-sigma regulatory factor